MTERTEQGGDPEVGICHICDREFPTQEELSKHLMDDHEGETLADAEGKEEQAQGQDGTTLDAPGSIQVQE